MRPGTTDITDYRCVNPTNVVGIGPIQPGSREKPLAAVDPEYLRDAAELCIEQNWTEVFVWEYFGEVSSDIVARGFAFSPSDIGRPAEGVVLAPRETPKDVVKVR